MTIKNGSVTNVEPNNIPYRVLPRVNVKSNTGSGARLIPIMTKRRRDTLSQQQIDCITPKSNIVGYVDGKPYIGDFHVMPNGNKMTGQTHSDNDRIIYNTPQESLRSGNVVSNARAERPTFRSIGLLITESESQQTTDNMTTYSDPVDDAGDTTPPPSSPPSTPPPSSPPSSGGGGYGGGY